MSSQVTSPPAQVTPPPTQVTPPPIPAILPLITARLDRQTERQLEISRAVLSVIGGSVSAVIFLVIVAASFCYAWPNENFFCDGFVHGERNGCPWHSSDIQYDTRSFVGHPNGNYSFLNFSGQKFISSASGWIFISGLVITGCSIMTLRRGLMKLRGQ
jgi:hypothetical protein